MRRLCVFLSWLYVGGQIAVLGVLTHLLSTPLGFLFLFQSELSKGWNWTGIEGQSSHHLRWSEISQKTKQTQWEAKDLEVQYDLSELGTRQHTSRLKVLKLQARSLVLSHSQPWKENLETFLLNYIESIPQEERSAAKSGQTSLISRPKVILKVDSFQVDEFKLHDLGVLKGVQLSGLEWGPAGLSVEGFHAESPWGILSGQELKWDFDKNELHFGRGLDLKSSPSNADSTASPHLRILGRFSPDTIFLDFEFWKGKIEVSRNRGLLSFKAKGLEIPPGDSWPGLSQVHFSVFNLTDWNQNPDELRFDWAGQTWSLESTQQNLVLKTPNLPQSELRLKRGLKNILSPWGHALSAGLSSKRTLASQGDWGTLIRAPRDLTDSHNSWIRVDTPASKPDPLKRRKR